MNPIDTYIAFPACYDATASAVFWALIIGVIAGKLIYEFMTKFDLYDETFRPFLVAAVVIGLTVLGLYYDFWTDCVALRIQGNKVVLEYLWPRKPMTLDAATIDDVSIAPSLQFYKPQRRWKHRLEIETNQKQEYCSRFVCIPMDKVGTSYQSALYTKLDDSVEKAEEAINECAIRAKFTSAQAKTASPFSFMGMFVATIRHYSSIAADKDVTEEQREAAMQRLNDYVALTKQSFGDDHCIVGLVYKFIGRAYALRGDMKNAKVVFAQAGKCQRSSGYEWYSALDRVNPNGLSLDFYEHPEWPRTPYSPLDY